MAGNKQPKKSKGLQMVTDRLSRGQFVPPDTVYECLEIRFAEAATERPRTDPKDKTRGLIQMNAYEALMAQGAFSGKDPGSGEALYTGAVKKDKEYHLMFGLPASGKSTIADRLSQASGSRIMDSDFVKEQIPEFDNGKGADAVHKESKHILNVAIGDTLKAGDNVIVPKLGSPPDQMIDLLTTAKAKGYKCYVHCVDLDPNKALARMIDRYMATGRYVPPKVPYGEIGPNGENRILESFGEVVRSGLVDGYTLWSNDVPFGHPPVLLAHNDAPDRSVQALIDGACTDSSKIIGVTPETPEQAGDAIDAIYAAIDEDEAEAARKSEELRGKAREQASHDAGKTGPSSMDKLKDILLRNDRIDHGADGRDLALPGE